MSNIARDPFRAPSRHDPLAGVRAGGGPELDVFLTGTVFFDIIFIGMDGPPNFPNCIGESNWLSFQLL